MKFTKHHNGLTALDRESQQLINQHQVGEEIELVLAGEALEGKKRTSEQNRAMWLWLTQVAVILNEAGIDMVLFLEKLNGTAEIPATKNSLHDRFWMPLLTHMTSKESTKDMDTKDIDLIYQPACKILAENFGIVPPPFPSWHNQGETK